MSIKIGVASDHAGYEYKNIILHWLQSQNLNTTDFGPYTPESVDYPDTAHPLSVAVESKDCDFGILICGSGNGVCMTANKHKGVRAGLAWELEVVKLIRQHNNANIMCIPARFVSQQQALDFVKVFLNTEFEGGRHATRISKINL